MIIVNRKPFRDRQNQVNQDKVIYYASGMVNWNILSHPNSFRPPTDVIETDDKLIIRVEVAGINSENFSINFDQHVISIRGIRQDSLSKRAFHQMEIRFGEFSVEIELPLPVQSDLVEATYLDGFLRLVLPKAFPKQIHIEE